jgi:hypothetical protein
MCDKETKKLLGDMEARLRESTKEEIAILRGELEGDIMKKYNEAIARIHNPSPETIKRLGDLENRWKWVYGFLGGNIIFLFVLIYSVGGWKASVDTGFDSVNEKINTLIITQQSSLDDKDSKLFDLRIQELSKRLELCEKK